MAKCVDIEVEDTLATEAESDLPVLLSPPADCAWFASTKADGGKPPIVSASAAFKA